MLKAFFKLNGFELILWLSSLAGIVICFLMTGEFDPFVLVASLIGATALIFVAKGEPLGQLLTVVFALLYSYISLRFRYYGEMLTYLGMSSPMAIAALVAWLKNPYEEGRSEVKINHVSPRNAVILWALAIAATAVFGYLLYLLETPNLFFSIISITTSFLASGYTVLRSPYYALAYAANDVVLIVLWILASMTDISLAPMVMSFVIFLINDSYGYFNWRRIRKRQEQAPDLR